MLYIIEKLYCLALCHLVRQTLFKNAIHFVYLSRTIHHKQSHTSWDFEHTILLENVGFRVVFVLVTLLYGLASRQKLMVSKIADRQRKDHMYSITIDNRVLSHHKHPCCVYKINASTIFFYLNLTINTFVRCLTICYAEPYTAYCISVHLALHCMNAASISFLLYKQFSQKQKGWLLFSIILCGNARFWIP